MHLSLCWHKRIRASTSATCVAPRCVKVIPSPLKFGKSVQKGLSSQTNRWQREARAVLSPCTKGSSEPAAPLHIKQKRENVATRWLCAPQRQRGPLWSFIFKDAQQETWQYQPGALAASENEAAMDDPALCSGGDLLWKLFLIRGRAAQSHVDTPSQTAVVTGREEATLQVWWHPSYERMIHLSFVSQLRRNDWGFITSVSLACHSWVSEWLAGCQEPIPCIFFLIYFLFIQSLLHKAVMCRTALYTSQAESRGYG